MFLYVKILYHEKLFGGYLYLNLYRSDCGMKRGVQRHLSCEPLNVKPLWDQVVMSSLISRSTLF